MYITKFSKWFYGFKARHPRIVMSLLVFGIIPLISSFILGYEMKSDVPTNIPLVLVNHDDSEFSRTFTGFIKDSEYFRIVKYSQNDNDIEEMIKKNEAYAGLIIPKNFYSDMRAGRAPSLITIYDGASLTVVTTSKTSLSEILLTAKAAYMMSVFEGKLGKTPSEVMNYVTPIKVNYKMLFNPTRSFRSYLLVGMLVAVIQVGIAMQGADRAFESKQRGFSLAVEAREILVTCLLSMLSIFICLLCQYFFFGMPYKGSIFALLPLTFLYASSIVLLGFIVGSIIPDRVFALQLSAVMVLPTSIMGGFTYPIYGMPTFFAKLAKFLPFHYYAQDLRHLYLGDMGIKNLMGTFTYFYKFIAVEILIATLLHFAWYEIRKRGKYEFQNN